MSPLLGWLLSFAVSVSVFGTGYWAGDHNRNNAWLASQGKLEHAAEQKYLAELKRGEDAAGTYLAESRTLQTQFEDLTEKFHASRKRIPLLAAVPGPGPGPGLACGGQPLDAAAPAVETARVAAPDGAGAAALTAGAVWMWNSALAGTDQPANTCSALDPTAPACAVATALSVDDAWDNHAVNARLCAEDRLSHQRLIDFLTLKAKP